MIFGATGKKNMRVPNFPFCITNNRGKFLGQSQFIENTIIIIDSIIRTHESSFYTLSFYLQISGSSSSVAYSN